MVETDLFNSHSLVLHGLGKKSKVAQLRELSKPVLPDTDQMGATEELKGRILLRVQM